MDPRLQRHIDACNNASLPGARLPFSVGPHQVGWVLPDLARVLGEFDAIDDRGDSVVMNPDMATDLPAIVEALAARNLVWFRGEEFDVRERPDGPVLTEIDRGALPKFGIQAAGVHLNGLVRRADGVYLWVAHRSTTKTLDPGKLDNLVAGGISAGMTASQTLLKEAAEEAGLSAEQARAAVAVSTVEYTMEREEGLRRDILHCYDLDLPGDFVPKAEDGEVARFELWPILKVLDTVQQTDDFKFNVNLVLIDLFRRLRIA